MVHSGILRERIFTKEELVGLSSNTSNVWYLSLLGEVFDVSKGTQYYAQGASYAFFTGRDASRAFFTGKFSEDLTDNITDFSDDEIDTLADWVIFYHKEYVFKGYLVGAFYDDAGRPSALQERVAASKQRLYKKKSKGKKFKGKGKYKEIWPAKGEEYRGQVVREDGTIEKIFV